MCEQAQLGCSGEQGKTLSPCTPGEACLEQRRDRGASCRSCLSVPLYPRPSSEPCGSGFLRASTHLPLQGGCSAGCSGQTKEGWEAPMGNAGHREPGLWLQEGGCGALAWWPSMGWHCLPMGHPCALEHPDLLEQRGSHADTCQGGSP